MALQTGKFPFIGRVGDMIGYKMNGKYYMRSAPESVQQTAATRKASQQFGIASNRSKLVRNAFKGQLSFRRDRKCGNRLNKVLVSGGLQGLTGFQFNPETSIQYFFYEMPRFTGKNKLSIPAQELRKIRRATSFELAVIAVTIDFKTQRITGTTSKDYSIDLLQPFKGLKMDIKVKGKGTLIVALEVRVELKDFLTFDKRFMAADILLVV